MSGGWLCRRSVQCVALRWTINGLMSEGITFSRTMSVRWFLKCISQARDCANSTTPLALTSGAMDLKQTIAVLASDIEPCGR